jgi:hypothetical protein
LDTVSTLALLVDCQWAFLAQNRSPFEGTIHVGNWLVSCVERLYIVRHSPNICRSCGLGVPLHA